jgi:hypothetical protein
MEWRMPKEPPESEQKEQVAVRKPKEQELLEWLMPKEPSVQPAQFGAKQLLEPALEGQLSVAQLRTEDESADLARSGEAS